MRTKCIWGLIILAVALFSGGNTFGAYEIKHYYLTHLVYENAIQKDRLFFSLQDGDGNLVHSNVVTSVSLLDPDNNPVPLEDTAFYTEDYIFNRHWEGLHHLFTYNDSFQPYSSYLSILQEDLQVGTYHIVIQTTNNTIEKDYYYHGTIDLPIIPSSSITGYEDQSGNFIMQWESPQDIAFWKEQIPTELRAFIIKRDGGVWEATIWPSLPTGMNMLYVPHETMEQLKSRQGELLVGVQMRTSGDIMNQNRSYSSLVPYENLQKKTPRAVVIPLN